MDRITSTHLHQLQALYYDIGDRGIRVDAAQRDINKLKIKAEIIKQLEIPSKQWGIHVYVGAENAPSKTIDSVNLNSTSGDKSLLNKMKDIGYHIPKITKKNEEGEYEQKFSVGELALQKMLTENQFNFPTGDPAIRAILKVRELGKLLSVYLSSRLLPRCETGDWNYYFLCIYNVAGTVTGRRTSRKHTFGYGNNAQNFPKHSEVAFYFLETLIPRPGNIFLLVDQIQAEEWPVSALSQNFNALADLETNKLYDKLKRVDRHSNLASIIFDTKVPWKGTPEYKLNKKMNDQYRFFGKKTKHAKNYGMQAKMMSDQLAQAGYCISPATCQMMLDKVSAADPTVDTVFHEYVKKQLSDTRMLETPFGRERMFIGARPNADNNKLFNEAYSFIPQSVVGDNTGFAVSYLEQVLQGQERCVVQEGHDSIIQDIPDDEGTILRYLDLTREAFNREVTFHNGIKITIPVEAEIGYDLKDTVPLDNMDAAGLTKALAELRAKREKKLSEKLQVA